MIPIGFCLILIGCMSVQFFPIQPTKHTVRDLFGIGPVLVGILVLVIGVLFWLWELAV